MLRLKLGEFLCRGLHKILPPFPITSLHQKIQATFAFAPKKSDQGQGGFIRPEKPQPINTRSITNPARQKTSPKRKKKTDKLSKSKQKAKKRSADKLLDLNNNKFESFEQDVSNEFASISHPPRIQKDSRQKKPRKSSYQKKPETTEIISPGLNDFFLQINPNNQVLTKARKLHFDDLLALLKTDRYYQNPEHSQRFNTVLTLLRKQSPLKFYERPEIMQSLEFIKENLDYLSPTNVAEYSVNLSKMKIDKLEFYKEIENYVLNNAFKFNLRGLANTAHSFVFISKKQSVLTDFQHLFKELETVIALKIKQTDPAQIDTKSVNQIMIAYSKTQNFSNEFLYFMEQVSLEIFDRCNPQEVSNILYSFCKNRYESESLLEKFESFFLQNTDKFKIKEIALAVEVFEKYNKITPRIIELLKKVLLCRGDYFNIQDLSVFFKTFMMHDVLDEACLRRGASILKELYRNMDQNSFANFTVNFSKYVNEGKLDRKFLKYWRRGLHALLKRKKIRGKYLDSLVREAKMIESHVIKEKIRILFKKYKPK